MKHVLLVGALAVVGCGGGEKTVVAPPTTTTAAVTPAPVDESWGPLGKLAGSWEGASDDKKSSGTLTIAADLGGKVLTRRGTNDSPQGHHEDFTVFSHTPDGALRADYFDNEGHVIRYAVTASTDGKQIVFASDSPGPKFRLTYTRKTDDDLDILFEMAPPGQSEFKKFNGGVIHRKH